MTDILWLAGDGIGPEIIDQAKEVVDVLAPELRQADALIGGQAIDEMGTPFPDATLQAAQSAKMIVLGAVGGPKWDQNPPELRPEKGLLQLRKSLGLFANIRPATLYPELAEASSLKTEVVAGLDIVIVRELTGGIYFGEPRGVSVLDSGEREGFNTYRYSETEIRRIAKVAFEMAQQRSQKLCSVDKANVLEVTRLWREIFDDVAQQYPDVSLSHLYVDNAAMQLIRDPKQFDVIVTGNMFGDILSDAAAELTGSIGMLPSASLREDGLGVYEPCHGSAPDIAGLNKANPLATLLSVAMGFRSSLGKPEKADLLEAAIQAVIKNGLRTPDIMSDASDAGHPALSCVSTEEMGQAVIVELQKLQVKNTGSL